MIKWRVLLSGHLFIFENGKFLFLDFGGRFLPVNPKIIMQEAPIKEIELDYDEFKLLKTALEAYSARNNNKVKKQ